MRLMGSYPKQEIIVQYGESDLAFIRRLAEHVGISFFFEHGGETDKWEFTDHAHGFGVIEGAEETSDATNDVCPSARRCFSGA